MSKHTLKSIFLLSGSVCFVAVAIFSWPGYGYKNYLAAKKTFKDLPGFASTEYSDDCTHWFGKHSTYFDFIQLPSRKPEQMNPSHHFVRGKMNGETSTFYLMANTMLPYDVFNGSDFQIYDKTQFIYFDPNRVSITKIIKNRPDLNGENFANRLVLFGMNQEGLSYNLSTSISESVSLVVFGEKRAFGCSPEKQCSFMGEDKKENQEKYWETFKKDDILTQVRTMCSRLESADIRAMLDDYRTAKITCVTPDQIQKVSDNYNNALKNCAAFNQNLIPFIDLFFANGPDAE